MASANNVERLGADCFVISFFQLIEILIFFQTFNSVVGVVIVILLYYPVRQNGYLYLYPSETSSPLARAVRSLTRPSFVGPKRSWIGSIEFRRIRKNLGKHFFSLDLWDRNHAESKSELKTSFLFMSR